jgi:beta-barrel assembly-enhancing protease
MQRAIKFGITTILFIGSAHPGFARKPGDPLKPGFNLYSKQQDIEVGKESAAQVKSRYQQVPNAELQDYITQLGQRLAKTPSAANSGFPFTFTLLNYREVNAFALPGGPTFVFTGLLKTSDSEAEVAGVLAHEISHVVLRHGTHRASKANVIEGPARIVGVINSFTLIGRLVNVGLGLGLDGIFLKNSREDESEADALGARIMSEAGYDPMALARFFQKLEKEGGPGVPEFLSDHPNPGNRVGAIEAEARTFPHRTYATDDRQFQTVKAAIAKLPASPDFRQKSIGISEARAAGYKKLSTPQFSLEYPGAWKVHGDSDANILAIAPDDGIIFVRGDPAMAVGSVVSYFFPDPNRSSLTVATGDLIKRLRTMDPGMRESASQKSIEAGKQPALLSQYSSDSPIGGNETDLLVTVARPEGLFHLIFISPDKDLSEARPIFDRMLQSLRFVESKP